MFLGGACKRARKRKRTNQEIPENGKTPEKMGKDKKGQKRTKKGQKGRTSPDREAPRLNPPVYRPLKSAKRSCGSSNTVREKPLGSFEAIEKNYFEASVGYNLN